MANLTGATSLYPGALDTFTRVHDGTGIQSTVIPAHFNYLADAMITTQTQARLVVRTDTNNIVVAAITCTGSWDTISSDGMNGDYGAHWTINLNGTQGLSFLRNNRYLHNQKATSPDWVLDSRQIRAASSVGAWTTGSPYTVQPLMSSVLTTPKGYYLEAGPGVMVSAWSPPSLATPTNQKWGTNSWPFSIWQSNGTGAQMFYPAQPVILIARVVLWWYN